MDRHPRTWVLALALAAAGSATTGCTSDPRVADHPDDARASSSLPTPSSASASPERLNGRGSPRDPGTYVAAVFHRAGTSAPQWTIDLPRGFKDLDDWYVVSLDNQLFLGLMTVERVERDACLGSAHDEVMAGSTVRDLARALADQRSTRATPPRAGSVGGHDGLFLEIRGPADLRSCDDFPALWRSPGERGIYSDDQVDRLWILDVGGQRVVVDMAYPGRGTSRAEIASLVRMVRSIRFVSTSAE